MHLISGTPPSSVSDTSDLTLPADELHAVRIMSWKELVALRAFAAWKLEWTTHSGRGVVARKKHLLVLEVPMLSREFRNQ